MHVIPKVCYFSELLESNCITGDVSGNKCGVRGGEKMVRIDSYIAMYSHNNVYPACAHVYVPTGIFNIIDLRYDSPPVLSPPLSVVSVVTFTSFPTCMSY